MFRESCAARKFSCLLVTVDVSSLHPNIDTKMAITALDLLLKEGKEAQTPLLAQLARLIFENNFLKSEFLCVIKWCTREIRE